jgi:hypothetical protein
MAIDLAQEDGGVSRPKLVWAIVIWYVLASVIIVGGYFILYSGMFALTAQAQKQADAFTALDHVDAVVLTALRLAAAVYLYRMKRMAAYLTTAIVALAVAVAALHYVLEGWGSVVAAYGSGGALFGSLISVLVCFYCWGLAADGRLR